LWQAAIRTVVAMTPSNKRPNAASGLATDPPLGPLRNEDNLRCAALLEALHAARNLAEAAAAGSSGALLAGLHLDLAAAEFADAADCRGAAGGALRDEPFLADRGSGGRLLIQRCMAVIQAHLERGAGSAEQLLACSRAVLHLDAAQHVWPEPAPARRTS
jgi:hypothetical protein